MAEWFRRKSDKIKTINRREITDGAWLKCPKCHEYVYKKIPINIFAQLAKSMDTAHKLAPKVKTPVRIFLANDDHVVPKTNGQTLLNMIGSNNKQLDLVDNSYHILSINNIL